MRLAAASLALIVFAGAAGAAEETFLFDALQKRPYRTAWDALMKDVQPTPDWLMQFNKNYDGAAGQLTAVTIDGKPYEISYVCKPTDCASRKFEVLFDAGPKHAYGALGGPGEAPAFFGNPEPALQDALTKAIKG